MLPKLLLFFVVVTWGPVRTYRETHREPEKDEVFARAETAEVIVDISKIKNRTGKLMVCLFRSWDGFPADMDKVAQKQAAEISGTTTKVTLKKVPPGEYYISAFHDENSNGKPDRNFMGIPKEGVGMINDDMKGMKPDFAKGHVRLNAGSQQVSIQLRYVL